MPESNTGELTERERLILSYVVKGYIESAQPVSSLYLTQHCNIGVSSATVRSVFVDLENKGYLFSPHRSAGRIPTERAYRAYVTQLPEERQITEDERALIQSEYLKEGFHLAQILNVTCRILSLLTNHAGVVFGPERDKTVLKHIELIDMGEDEVLVVLATRSGIVYSRTIYLDSRIPGDMLRQISNYLNTMFKGCDLKEIKTRLLDYESDTAIYDPYYKMITNSILANFDAVHGEQEFYTAGLDKLYGQVLERKEKIEEVANLFDSGNLLKPLFKKTVSLDNVQVTIEGDRDSRLAGLSIVSAHYKMGAEDIGTIGVVGPNRMDYNRVVGVVDFISHLISGMITRISN